jgi:hypothetical protein
LGGACACGPLASYNPDRLPMQQMSRIGEICRDVMGLPAGAITHYLACEESLSHSIAARGDGGAAPGASAAPPAKALKSYFLATNDEVHRREQEACARIGFDSVGGGFAFAQCVADLQSNLFDADNPHWVP